MEKRVGSVEDRKRSVDGSSEIKTEPGDSNGNMDCIESADGTVCGVNKDHSKKKKKRNSVPESEVVDGKTCGQCGKRFASASSLKLHLNVHKEDKPYKCDVCEKGFSAPASLTNHKLLHTGETFKCEYCDYSAVQKGNLKSHRWKVHKDIIENEKAAVEETPNLYENNLEAE